MTKSPSRSVALSAHPRRSFLERLGLGVGATMLGPIASRLVSEARGAETKRKRCLLFMLASGFPADAGNDSPLETFAPKEFRTLKPEYGWEAVAATKTYTWPGILKNMESYRSKSLLIDGASNEILDSQHSCGYGALSCLNTDGQAEHGGGPNGATIDQLIANVINPDTRLKSALLGVTLHGDLDTQNTCFASGPGQRLTHLCDAKLIFKALFGDAMASASGVDKGRLRKRLVLDALRADLKRVQGAFAGEEKAKLDRYLSVMEDFEKRLSAGGTLTCSPEPYVMPAPTSNDSKFNPPAEARTEMVFLMAKMALLCGVTNSVSIAVGSGYTHNTFPNYKLGPYPLSPFWGRTDYDYLDDEGHGENAKAMVVIHNWHLSFIKQIADALSAVPEGSGTIFDNTAIIHTSENGEAHHSSHTRWPVAIYGNAGGAIRADGRYLRFARSGGTLRALADVYATIGSAYGIPNPQAFGAGGPHPLGGLVSEMLS